ncbi:MAG: glycosyltransferase [Phycisphaerae bacterium]|nr:glycosyltransferase [Phycisphaerae bacterium]
MTHYLAWLILIIYAASLLPLCWGLLRTIRLVKEQRALPPVGDDAGGAQDWPTLDVLVPVKDEADNIAECLGSILAQEYPRVRVTVVNDRSTDDTAQVVQAIQDGHPELSRVDIAELPDGCYGKPHGLHTVAKDLTGDVVAFVDSDLYLKPGCLRTLVHHLTSNKLDWVATMGAPAMSRFWEKLIVPLFGAIAFAWYNPRKISDPDWPDAIGSAFMICRRDAYEAIGGHGAVIDVYDEDSELIRIAKRARQKVSFVIASELFTQRHYGSLANTVRGLTRTCIGGIKTVPRLLVTINSLNFVSLLPFGILVLLGIASWIGSPLMWWPLWLGMAVFHVAVSTALAWLCYRTADADCRYALLHPLGSAVLMGICLRATIHLLRGTPITWRGTTYSEKDKG